MNELYEKQEDGRLKPVNLPEKLLKNKYIHLFLREDGLTLEEIKFLWEVSFTC